MSPAAKGRHRTGPPTAENCGKTGMIDLLPQYSFVKKLVLDFAISILRLAWGGERQRRDSIPAQGNALGLHPQHFPKP
jgi:hypothetical protein